MRRATVEAQKLETPQPQSLRVMYKVNPVSNFMGFTVNSKARNI